MCTGLSRETEVSLPAGYCTDVESDGMKGLWCSIIVVQFELILVAIIIYIVTYEWQDMQDQWRSRSMIIPIVQYS